MNKVHLLFPNLVLFSRISLKQEDLKKSEIDCELLLDPYARQEKEVISQHYPLGDIEMRILVFLNILTVFILCAMSTSEAQAYQCYGTPYDDPNVCSGHGICVAENDCDCDSGWTGDDCLEPTLVQLVDFTAVGLETYVRLSWHTATEIDTAGFHIWRADAREGEYVRITDILVSAEGGPTYGAEYAYEDTDVVPGVTYYYKLEDIDYDGVSTFHGPVWAWAGLVDIKANGSDGPIVVLPNAPLSVSVDLNPGEYEGQSSDLWIAANTPFAPPFDWYTYLYPTGWLPGLNLCVQTRLFPFSGFEVLNMTLPPGNYTFYFAVDAPDGMLTAEWLDYVVVNVN